MKIDQTVFLNHILDAIAKIEKYLKGIDEKAFKKNDLLQDGVIRQIEIIGEAVKRLSSDVTSKSPDLPWQDIAGMRDKLIHDYFGVDVDTVWLTAQNDLPELKKELIKIIKQLDQKEIV